VSMTTKEKAFLSVFCLLAWAGVFLQLFLSIATSLENGKTLIHGVIMYTGYFTVLTNIYIAVLVTLRVTGVSTNDSVRGCATTAILLVGIVYHFILKDIWEPTGAQWLADVMLHYVTPILALIYWIAYPPTNKVTITELFKWLLYPLAYLLYVLIRGEIVNLYPYPFIDLMVLEGAQVFVNSLGINLSFLAIGAAVTLLANWRRNS
jgi:hypothetical protein